MAPRAVCGDLSSVVLPPLTPLPTGSTPSQIDTQWGKGPGVDRGALCLLGWNKLPCVLFSSLCCLPPTAGPQQAGPGGREVGKVLGRALRHPLHPQYPVVAS